MKTDKISISSATPVGSLDTGIKKWCNLCWKHLATNRHASGWLQDTPFGKYVVKENPISGNSYKDRAGFITIDKTSLDSKSFMYFMGDVMVHNLMEFEPKDDFACPVTFWGNDDGKGNHCISIATDCSSANSGCGSIAVADIEVRKSMQTKINNSEIKETYQKYYKKNINNVLSSLHIPQPLNHIQDIEISKMAASVFSEDLRCLAKIIGSLSDEKIDNPEYVSSMISRQILRWGIVYGWADFSLGKVYKTEGFPSQGILIKEKISAYFGVLDEYDISESSIPTWEDMHKMCMEWYDSLPQIISNMVCVEKILRANDMSEVE